MDFYNIVCVCIRANSLGGMCGVLRFYCRQVARLMGGFGLKHDSAILGLG